MDSYISHIFIRIFFLFFSKTVPLSHIYKRLLLVSYYKYTQLSKTQKIALTQLNFIKMSIYFVFCFYFSLSLKGINDLSFCDEARSQYDQIQNHKCFFDPKCRRQFFSVLNFENLNLNRIFFGLIKETKKLFYLYISLV